jgi:Spy/CpxP family protein refolding chaperone
MLLRRRVGTPETVTVAIVLFLWMFLLAGAVRAYGHQGPPPPNGMGRPTRDSDPMHRPPPGRGPQNADEPLSELSGKWWTNPVTVQRLQLSEDQQKRIDQIFQQSRLKLIDLRAGLEKEEAVLDPLLAADHPQEAQVLSQIDRVAMARAELEKANARMLFSFRLVLTPEQWRQLKAPPGGAGNMQWPRKR